jgi:ATP synthase I chain
MREIADSPTPEVEVRNASTGLEARLQRSMIVSIGIAASICLFAAPWQVTSGLILGGALSILNYRWLHSSVAAIFQLNLDSARPRAGVSRYVLRYLVVGAVVFAAVNLQIVSLAATLAGLCGFVPALFIEAGREFYHAIIHREESF